MKRIKTTIFTGFLGAGKTTLLNHLLSSAYDQRVVVIVNEYGEVGIDGEIIVETDEEVIELNNGCICCTVRSDLIGAIGRLLASDLEIDHIIVETSGLADPAPVIQSFYVDETLATRLEIDAIVTVVDALHVPDQLARDEAREQICFADLLLVNKTDLVEPADLERVEKQLRQLNPLARIQRTQYCAIDPASVLKLGAFDLKNILSIEPDLLAEDAHDHDHDDTIGCVAILEPTTLEPTALNQWLNTLVQDIGKDLLRMKGVISLQDEPRRFVCHGVHMMLDGRPGKAWRPEEARTSRMVFIGHNLDEAALREGFDACRAADYRLAG